jgi:ankyrin repeat protein
MVGNPPEKITRWLQRFRGSWDIQQPAKVNGNYPLMMASFVGQPVSFLRALVQGGADPVQTDIFGANALFGVGFNADGDVEAARYLLTLPSVKRTINTQMKCSSKLLRVVFWLVRQSIRLGYKGTKLRMLGGLEGNTALHNAVDNGHVDLARELVLAGADPKLRKVLGSASAYDYAREVYGKMPPDLLHALRAS